MKNYKPEQRMDIKDILKDLESYRPKRKEWVWREKGEFTYGAHTFKQASPALKNSIPLPGSRHVGGIDPQPDATITTEISSGRFEDDIRRFRMAAWHGADHIMVIRTTGQSHIEGLIEGTPQGIGGIPVSRKVVRAQRKALDFIEEEVGRKINYHSYVSGVAGPDIAVMFAEEGVNGVHQDPQYNVYYRNINMIRSFVDAGESKKIIADAGQAQIDGAHNANATARDAWKVAPELLVQHAINSRFSELVGISPDKICLSTVPPAAPPTPDLVYNLPYAVALREFFDKYKMRAQQNTKYMDSSTREATVTHVLNLLISRLTSADIQSTITPDEGRNVPWHIYNIEAVSTAKQAMAGMDNLTGMVELKKSGYLAERKREIQEKAVLMFEEMLGKEIGGYFNAVERGMFVDSGEYPARNGDGIARELEGGVGFGTVFERDPLYMAPVTSHFGNNNIARWGVKQADELIGGDTLHKPEKIQFIDELDPTDNAYVRMEENEKYRDGSIVKPEVEWLADGTVTLDLMFSTDAKTAQAAALVVAKNMNMENPVVIHTEVLHPSEGTRVQVKGVINVDVKVADLVIPEDMASLSDDELHAEFQGKGFTVIAGTIGEDEHSVGIREVLDIKHGGVEKYGLKYVYLGTSVAPEKYIDAAIEHNAKAIMISAIISHDNIHYKNMKKVHDYAIEKGVRDKLIIVAGGTQVVPEKAVEEGGMDAGFTKGTKGNHIASFFALNKKGASSSKAKKC